ncbi:MAG: succinate dehydrogenase, cytochrome b556 subunit [Holosporales bacterium]
MTTGKVERPLSPHLGIYRVQLTSGLSILHRMTGLVLYGFSLLLAFWFYSLAFDPAMLQCLMAWGQSFWMIGLAGLGFFAFFYHLSNGIRHLLWDWGVGFELSATYRSGWLVILLTFSLTAGALILLLIHGGYL